MIYTDIFPPLNPWEQMDKNIEEKFSDRGYIVLQDPENSLFDIGDEYNAIGNIPKTLEIHIFDHILDMYSFIDKRMMNDYTKVYVKGKYDSKIISDIRG